MEAKELMDKLNLAYDDTQNKPKVEFKEEAGSAILIRVKEETIKNL